MNLPTSRKDVSMNPLLGLSEGLVTGMVLGFSIAAPPGPINAAIANRIASSKSWRSGFDVGLGAMTADGFFLLMTYLGWTRVISTHAEFFSWIYLTGGVVLVIYALFVLLRYRSAVSAVVQKAQRNVQSTKLNPSQAKQSYALGLSMGLTNPYQIAWWLSVGLAAISSFGALVAAGFFLGIVIENTIYTTALMYGFLRFKKIDWVVLITTSAVLLAFGFWFLTKGMEGLFT